MHRVDNRLPYYIKVRKTCEFSPSHPVSSEEFHSFIGGKFLPFITFLAMFFGIAFG